MRQRHGKNEGLVRWLVEQGADINRADAVYGRTPLHLHAMRRSGDVGIFLELGADVHRSDKCGNTALHFAAAQAVKKSRRDCASWRSYGCGPTCSL